MPKINRLQTLQYMGSKSRMLENICTPIIENKNITTILDLFAGTGSVGYALAPYKSVISNDLELYSYVINEAILNGCCLCEDELDTIKKGMVEKYEKSISYINSAVVLEDMYLQCDLDMYEKYSEFSDNTPSVFNAKTEIKELQVLSELVDRVKPGEPKQDVPFPCLFLTYYANAYFGLRQCCQIDAIATQIHEISDIRKKNVLMSALMSALSIVASTTTHFAQFLKVNSKGTFKNIKEKRKQNIFELFYDVIERFNSIGLLNKDQSKSKCYNLDFFECLSKLDVDSHTLVYADPPYFKEHYSRYYHVLNTLCLYDYPMLAINPQTKEYSVGRYRTDRKVSDFGKKAKVLDAFRRMINLCADKRACLLISYSENSLVKIYELLDLAKERYQVKVEKVELKHSSQGRVTDTDQTVNEYLFFCEEPDSRDVEIERLVENIRDIKPIVDNPGGFIHNYMARKPYNVVSKIVSAFTDENSIVFDPMFGSGTTLIEASKLGRNAVGCDINPIAFELCKISLEEWDLNKVNLVIDEFVALVESKCENIYEYSYKGEKRIIERCHFDIVDGKLVPIMYWYKISLGKELSGRKKGEATDDFIKEYQSYSSKKMECIVNKKLIPNSRIAIKDGSTVFDYFCNRNLSAMDTIMSILRMFKGKYGYNVLCLIVSSAINLIKLSDKKASSQMPYWLPQKNVTSRNACFVVAQKAQAVKDGLVFLNNECRTKVGNGIKLFNMPAQNIGKTQLADGSVDLILTDPPYTDQVPYLEYNQLWFNLFGMDDEVKFNQELVVSDAPSRKKTYEDFNIIFRRVIRKCFKVLKKDGIFVMFYHTFDLKSWANILQMMREEGLRYSYQIPTPAPRKSFKTIMSPRSTLDGNYLIFFVKDSTDKRRIFSGEIGEAVDTACDCAIRIVNSHNRVTTQDLYDKGMLKEAFEQGYLEILSDQYKTFADVVKNKLRYVDGYWEVK